MWLFYYFDFQRNHEYDVFKSKSPCILLNKIINFSKSETESKMENPTHSFRETIWLYSVLNTFLEYTYFYISKNIASYFFCLFLKSSKAFSISLRSLILVFIDLISFIVISRLPVTRLNKFFCCFSDSSLNISLIRAVNLSSFKQVLSLYVPSWKKIFFRSFRFCALFLLFLVFRFSHVLEYCCKFYFESAF